MTGETFLLLQIATTLPLTGLIAFVQFAHYPLLAELGPEAFPRYHARYLERITPIVAPLMLVELAASIGWAIVAFGSAAFPLAILGLALVGGIWLSTTLLQVPCHQRLAAGGRDTATIRRLVRTNAVRTAAWALRSAVVVTAWVA